MPFASFLNSLPADDALLTCGLLLPIGFMLMVGAFSYTYGLLVSPSDEG